MGIDPGSSGGMVVFSTSGSYALTALKKGETPMTPRDIWDWVNDAARFAAPLGGIRYAVMEKVGGYMGVGAGGQDAHPDGSSNRASGHTMFAFGKSTGFLEMALIAASIPYDLVTPQAWQKAFNLKRGKTEKKTAWKRRLTDTARLQGVPFSQKITNATGDATLMALYARYTKEGTSHADPSA